MDYVDTSVWLGKLWNDISTCEQYIDKVENDDETVVITPFVLSEAVTSVITKSLPQPSPRHENPREEMIESFHGLMQEYYDNGNLRIVGMATVQIDSRKYREIVEEWERELSYDDFIHLYAAHVLDHCDTFVIMDGLFDSDHPGYSQKLREYIHKKMNVTVRAIRDLRG